MCDQEAHLSPPLQSPGALYAVILSDPDAPNPTEPKFAEWIHYLAVNVRGCDLKSGDENVRYFGSAPGQGAGVHRYCVVVYEQTTGAIAPEAPVIPLRRCVRTCVRGRQVRLRRRVLKGPLWGDALCHLAFAADSRRGGASIRGRLRRRTACGRTPSSHTAPSSTRACQSSLSASCRKSADLRTRTAGPARAREGASYGSCSCCVRQLSH